MSKPNGADVNGVDDVLRNLRRLGDRAVAAAVRGLDVAGEHVIGDSMQLAPVDTGALQASATTLPASATTLPAEVAGDTIVKIIGHNTHYAAAVHEVLSAHHPIGQAKYLETAIRRNADGVSRFVAEQVKGETGGAS